MHSHSPLKATFCMKITQCGMLVLFSQTHFCEDVHFPPALVEIYGVPHLKVLVNDVTGFPIEHLWGHERHNQCNGKQMMLDIKSPWLQNTSSLFCPLLHVSFFDGYTLRGQVCRHFLRVSDQQAGITLPPC